MSEPPAYRIVRGSPSPLEEAAINAAILKIWREDIAAAAKGSETSAWVLAARAASLPIPFHAAGGEHAWRLSLRTSL